ncbi:hypothetical protein INR49_023687 [Caranx melampygus]|nr:hypothetical protein INR49_023687 [Caranx melampygus]
MNRRKKQQGHISERRGMFCIPRSLEGRGRDNKEAEDEAEDADMSARSLYAIGSHSSQTQAFKSFQRCRSARNSMRQLTIKVFTPAMSGTESGWIKEERIRGIGEEEEERTEAASRDRVIILIYRRLYDQGSLKFSLLSGLSSWIEKQNIYCSGKFFVCDT